jgi:hypothetical protein
MARPSKPEDQRAALVVGVRLTPAEKALVDQLTAPGPDGAPPRWTSASGLLRGLLHREAQRRGLEPPDSADVDGNPGDLDVVGSPAPPAPGLDSVTTNSPGSGSGSAPAPPAGPPSPALGGLPSALGGGVLPAGTLLLVWPPGWPLPMAPGGTFPVVAPPPPAPGAHEFIPQGGPATPGTVPPNVPTHQLRETGAAEALPGSHPGAPALAGEPHRGPRPGRRPRGLSAERSPAWARPPSTLPGVLFRSRTIPRRARRRPR